MKGTRSPLCNREQPDALDVSLALTRLVELHERNGNCLPVAYDKDGVIDRLIYMANVRDGKYVKPSKANKRALYDLYFNRMTNSSLFLAGYKKYEKDTEMPVVPVNKFFLVEVLSRSSDVEECLLGMTPFDIEKSLPKRNSKPVLKDDAGKIVEEYIHSGEIAGVLIFPKDYDSDLLRYWLDRRVKNGLAALNGASRAVEHAVAVPAMEPLRLARGQVENTLREAVSGLGRYHRVLIEADD